jgi:hypothetical protein
MSLTDNQVASTKAFGRGLMEAWNISEAKIRQPKQNQSVTAPVTL